MMVMCINLEYMEMMVEVTSCEGQLIGYLLEKENNPPMYKRLEKEKLLRLLFLVLNKQ